jgi:hypothetical protein
MPSTDSVEPYTAESAKLYTTGSAESYTTSLAKSCTTNSGAFYNPGFSYILHHAGERGNTAV